MKIRRKQNIKAPWLALMFLLLTGYAADSQIVSEVNAEPRPYILSPPYFDYKNTRGIKSATIVIRTPRGDSFSVDTIMAYQYNRKGEQMSRVRYENNKPGDRYEFEFNEDTISGWRAYDSKSKLSAYASFEFNKTGNLVKTLGYTYAGKDSTRNEKRFSYDNEGRLILLESSLENTSVINSYRYEANRLREHRSSRSDNSDRYFFALYNYNSEGQLTERKDFQKWDTGNILVSYRKFEYAGSDLSTMRYGNAPGNKEVKVDLAYDNERRLSKMNISQDTVYKNVVYEYYPDDKIKSIEVKGNHWNALHGEITIPFVLPSTMHLPFLYREEYRYDNKGTIIEKTHLLEGQAKKIISYLVTYY